MGGEFALSAGVLNSERAPLLYVSVAACALICSGVIVALGVLPIPESLPVRVVAQPSPSRLVVALDTAGMGALRETRRVTLVTGDTRIAGTVVAVARRSRTAGIILAVPLATRPGTRLFLEAGRTTVARLITGSRSLRADDP